MNAHCAILFDPKRGLHNRYANCKYSSMQNVKGNNSLVFVERVSKLMDSQFKIGNFKFGLDPILNLIPFAGDSVTAIISFALVYNMQKHGASSKIVVKMMGNVILDFIVGAIPLIGWVFDFYFKANDRNVKLLKEHYIEGKHTGSAKGLLTLMLIAFIIVIGLGLWAIWAIGKWFIGLF